MGSFPEFVNWKLKAVAGVKVRRQLRTQETQALGLATGPWQLTDSLKFRFPNVKWVPVIVWGAYGIREYALYKQSVRFSNMVKGLSDRDTAKYSWSQGMESLNSFSLPLCGLWVCRAAVLSLSVQAGGH